MTKRQLADQAYYAANRERLLAKSRAWYEANKAKVLARGKTYRSAHREMSCVYSKRWRTANPAKVKAGKKAWRAANLDQARKVELKHNRKYYANNHAQILAKAKEYYAANRTEVLERDKEYRRKHLAVVRAKNRAWQRANPGKVNALCAKRKAAKLRATPAWADQGAIKAIYKEAARLTRETGIVYHVDHIYPLQGEDVCGLHVAANLQIITAFENIGKKNRHPDRYVKRCA